MGSSALATHRVKRSALTRKTPLRTLTPGLKRSRLRSVAPGQTRRLKVPRTSARTAAYEAEFRSIRPYILSRSRGVCEACGDVACGPVAHVHHRQRRAHGGPNSEANLIAVSLAHHERIHANPAESYRRGWLVKSWEDPAEVEIIA